jgi:hypothetical protein
VERLKNDPVERARARRDAEIIFGVIPRSDTVLRTDSADTDTVKP